MFFVVFQGFLFIVWKRFVFLWEKWRFSSWPSCLLLFLISSATCKRWEAWRCLFLLFRCYNRINSCWIMLPCFFYISWHDKFVPPVEDTFEKGLGMAVWPLSFWVTYIPIDSEYLGISRNIYATVIVEHNIFKRNIYRISIEYLCYLWNIYRISMEYL
jgi:hypothetical protein